jgi:hypothetical protein
MDPYGLVELLTATSMQIQTIKHVRMVLRES